MKKAIFGIAAVLALTTTSASARDAKVIEKAVASDTSAARVGAGKAKGVTRAASKSADVQAPAAQAGASASKMNAIDVNAPHAERWLVEREGYRDGGY